ncbi:NAD kinase [Xylocopilactobacillus apicola]|uniref:NAD kinase n=1 Tax=Xylocopilactobacillus apicola TaxID=2932184 RepID=A0AAU9D9I3_9LACO|nr:NAD kinase [Xylocopilactobacillus apicola]BDR59015.1 NAD kinase [Xylocopilactobacillus apicola]
MKVAIFSNTQPATILVVEKLKQLLKEKNITVVEAESDPEIVISVGGDGTMLSAFRHYLPRIERVRFIGVHTGHLGFYTDYREFELDELVDSLSESQCADVSYPILRVEAYKGDSLEPFLIDHALNESTVRRVVSTFTCNVLIKGDFFEKFRGDGLSISTPTGSTAYNKSLGGAVIHPTVKALQVTEIASLNNSIFRTLGSPMVISPDEWVEVELLDPTDVDLSVDNLILHDTGVTRLKYQIAKERIHFVKYRHMHFWDRVGNSFIYPKKKYD